MSRDFTALLERLPELKASNVKGLPRWKKRDLMMSPEKRAARNARRAQLRKQRYRLDPEFRAKECSRLKQWYEDRGKFNRHGCE